MFCDEAVSDFSNFGKDARFAIPPQRPLPFWIFCERKKNGFSAGVNRAIGFNELDRFLKLLARNFGKVLCDLWILKRQIIHSLAGQFSPTRNPKFAKITVAVENHQRF